jgi:hypothetical protein
MDETLGYKILGLRSPEITKNDRGIGGSQMWPLFYTAS